MKFRLIKHFNILDVVLLMGLIFFVGLQIDKIIKFPVASESFYCDDEMQVKVEEKVDWCVKNSGYNKHYCFKKAVEEFCKRVESAEFPKE